MGVLLSIFTESLNAVVSLYVLFHVQHVALRAHICRHVSRGIHWWIYLLSLIILCFADGTYQPPQSLHVSLFFFPLSPLYRQTEKQMIILWTYYPAWSSYHNQPSWVSNLGSAKLCSPHNGAFISVLPCVHVCFFYFLSLLRACARQGSQKRKVKGNVCTHLHVSLETPHHSQISQVCGQVRILETLIHTYNTILLAPFQWAAYCLCLCPCPANNPAPHGQEHMFGGLHHRGKTWPIKGAQNGPPSTTALCRILLLQGIYHKASLLLWRHIKHKKGSNTVGVKKLYVSGVYMM